MNGWVILFICVGVVVLVLIPLAMQHAHVRDSIRQEIEEAPTMLLSSPATETTRQTKAKPHTTQTPTGTLVRSPLRTAHTTSSGTRSTPSYSGIPVEQSPVKNVEPTDPLNFRSSGIRPLSQFYAPGDFTSSKNPNAPSQNSMSFSSNSSVPFLSTNSSSSPPESRIYDEGIQFTYDQDMDAIHISFLHCPIRTPEEASCAARILFRKTVIALSKQKRQRSAFLIDVSGLEVSKQVAPMWGKLLKEFLMKMCIEVTPGNFLVARYNSQPVSKSNNPRESVKRIHNTAPLVAYDFQNDILHSRKEAAARLIRIRQLPTTTG